MTSVLVACRDAEQARSSATELQHDLQTLQGDHARLAEQYDLVQTCTSALQHDLKVSRHNLKQVCGTVSLYHPVHSNYFMSSFAGIYNTRHWLIIEAAHHSKHTAQCCTHNLTMKHLLHTASAGL